MKVLYCKKEGPNTTESRQGQQSGKANWLLLIKLKLGPANYHLGLLSTQLENILLQHQSVLK